MFQIGWEAHNRARSSMGRFYRSLGPALYWALLDAMSRDAALVVALLRRPLLQPMEPRESSHLPDDRTVKLRSLHKKAN